jgi:hypothetical protein
MEEREDGLLLHPNGSSDARLSWEETARQMAMSDEDWSDWDVTTGDGTDGIAWDHRIAVVAERRESYRTDRVKGLGKHRARSAS